MTGVVTSNIRGMVGDFATHINVTHDLQTSIFRSTARVEMGLLSSPSEPDPNPDNFTYTEPYSESEPDVQKFYPLQFQRPEGTEDPDDYDWFNEIGIDYEPGTQGRVYTNEGLDRLANINLVVQFQLLAFAGTDGSIEDNDSKHTLEFGLYNVTDKKEMSGEFKIDDLIDPTDIIAFQSVVLPKRASIVEGAITYTNEAGGYSDLISEYGEPQIFQYELSVSGVIAAETSFVVFVRNSCAFRVTGGRLAIAAPRK